MSKKRYPQRKFGANRRSYRRVAGTCNDQRCHAATQINNSNNRCKNGYRIMARKVQDTYTLHCMCGHQIQRRGNQNKFDLLADFADTHP